MAAKKMTYEQRRKNLIQAILAKLRESGHESDVIEPDDRVVMYAYFRRSHDGVMATFYATPFYTGSRFGKFKTDYVQIEIRCSRTQMFRPYGEWKGKKTFKLNKDVDPAKVAAKVIREYEIEAKRLSETTKVKP